MPPSSPTAALIVEGQPFVGLVASDILKESGLATFHASDGAGAMALLRSHPEIEVVVADADLSGEMNGLELSRRVSAERPDIQLVRELSVAASSAQRTCRPARRLLLRKPYASAEFRHSSHVCPSRRLHRLRPRPQSSLLFAAAWWQHCMPFSTTLDCPGEPDGECVDALGLEP